jgi:hypothetical protein
MENKDKPFVPVAPRPERESIDKAKISHKQIVNTIAEELGIAYGACDAVLNAYRDIIIRELRDCNRVSVHNLMTVTPMYIHPHERISYEGEPFMVMGKITFYVRLQKPVYEVKKFLNETNKETNE